MNARIHAALAGAAFGCLALAAQAADLPRRAPPPPPPSLPVGNAYPAFTPA